MSGNQTSNTQVIPMLSTLPPSMEPIKIRLEALGYLLPNFGSAEMNEIKLLAPPKVALVPLTFKMSVEQIQKRISTYLQLYSGAKTHFVAIYSGRLVHQMSELLRVGIKNFFQVPLEDEMLVNKLYELSPIPAEHKNLSLDQLTRVSIVEIEKTKQMPFNLYLYLPANLKTLLYIEKGKAIDERTIKKFHENQNYNLYIHRSDIKAYQDYGRQVIMEYGYEESLALAEKNKQVAGRIGGLMGAFFSDADYSETDGQQMLENLKAFTHELPATLGKSGDLQKNTSQLASQKLSSSTHSLNVAAYCALFGMTLGLENAESLRMGGLLHDVGLSELPPDLAALSKTLMSDAESKKYQSHAVLGKNAIERLKLAVPQEVLDMVIYHHEHSDGSGYPEGRKADQISPYAKVCAFADEFDKLTSVRSSYPQLSPTEAIKRIAGLDGSKPSPIYDAAFHRPLVDAFLKKNGPSKTAVQVDEPPPTKVSGVPAVTIGRLLKTPEFAKPTFLPEVKFKNWQVTEEIEGFSEQLNQHFKKRFVGKRASP